MLTEPEYSLRSHLYIGMRLCDMDQQGYTVIFGLREGKYRLFSQICQISQIPQIVSILRQWSRTGEISILRDV